MDRQKQKGFTLPELMVVVLIIAILMAVAVPAYLNARNRAVVRSAQQKLSNVIKAAKELHGGGNTSDVDDQTVGGISYITMTPAQLNAEMESDTVIIGEPPSGNRKVGLTSQGPKETITFKTRDANDDMHTATIDEENFVEIQ